MMAKREKKKHGQAKRTKRNTPSKGLPQSWEWATLREVCLRPQYGWTTRASGEGKLHLLRTTDITSGEIDWESVPYCGDEPLDKERYLLHDGDIVISRAGSVGFSLLVRNPEPAIFASYLIRFKPLIDGQYVAYFLQSPTYWQSISEKSAGIALANVNATKLMGIRFPLAPLSEQHRIAAEIEKQFTRLDVGIVALKRAQENLKRYKAGVLKAAVEGKLASQEPHAEPADKLLDRILVERRAKTKGLEGRYREPVAPETESLPDLPEGWVWATIDELSSHITSGSRGWARYYSTSGRLFIRVGNFNRLDTSIDLSEVVFVKPPKGPEKERTRLELDDLLVTITADVGMVGVVDSHVLKRKEAFINQHVALVRPVLPEVAPFVAWVIASEPMQKQFKGMQYGVTKVGMSLIGLKRMTVPIAPLSEQSRIVAEIKKRFAKARELEASIASRLDRAETLRQSILTSAFSGKLVPQDRNDEPASILLERVRKERARRLLEEKAQRATKKKERGVRMTRAEKRKPLWEIVSESKKRMKPRELFDKARFTAETIEEFYEELREQMHRGRIKQIRPNDTDVFLEAVKQ